MFSRRQFLLASALPLAYMPSLPLVIAQGTQSPLREMLAFVPPRERILGEKPDTLISWVDIKAVAESVGLAGFPEDIGKASEFSDATLKVPLDSPFLPYALKDWDELLGFGPQNVEQLLSAYEYPNGVRIYRGQFDPERIAGVLSEKDYVNENGGGFVILASPSGDDLDSTREIDRLGVGAFNYLAVSESLVITTSHQASLDLVLETIETGESLAGALEGSDLLPMLEPLSGCYLMDGGLLSRSQLDIADTVGNPTLPPATLFAAGARLSEEGTTAGFMIEFTDQVDEDVVEIIKSRIETSVSMLNQQPISEIMGPVEVTLVPGTSIVQILGETDLIATRWQRMLLALDLAIVATE